MSLYLIEREKDELLKSETRCLTMPDGSTRDVTAFNIVWRWYDRITTARTGQGEEAFLAQILELHHSGGLPFDEEFAACVETKVRHYDEHDIDCHESEADVWLASAKRASERFQARKMRRYAGNSTAST